MTRLRDTYVQDVEFLRSCGIGDGEILTRLGVKAPNLARALHRGGRTDLALPFWRIEWADRPGRAS